MPDLLRTIAQHWAVTATHRGAPAVLARWQRREPALAEITRLADLAAVAQSRTDLEKRDEVHRAIIRLAGTDETALLAELALLRPGLALIAWRHRDTWDHDEAQARTVALANRPREGRLSDDRPARSDDPSQCPTRPRPPRRRGAPPPIRADRPSR